MKRGQPRVFYLIFLNLAYAALAAGMCGSAVAAGARLSSGQWGTPVQLLLQEHSVVLLATWLPAMILGFGALRISRDSRPAKAAIVIGLLGLLSLSLPLIRAHFHHRSLQQRLEAALGESDLAAAEQAQTLLRSNPVNLAAWMNLPSRPGPEVLIDTVVFRTVGEQELHLDRYHSDNSLDAPVLIFIHGGGLVAGSRQDTRSWALDYARRGFVALSIDYRLAPRVQIEESVEDVLCAVWWAQASYGGRQPAWIGLVGFSSGGHLALVASDWAARGWVSGDCPVDQQSIHAIVAVAPVTDLSFYGSTVLGLDIQNSPERAARIAPIALAAQGIAAPPRMIVHGRRDSVVPFEQTVAYVDALADSAAVTLLLDPPWSDHLFYAMPGGLASQVTQYHMDRFLAWAQQATGE